MLQACAVNQNKTPQQVNSQDWPSFGHDFTSQRFSPNTQVNQKNVKDLVQAWQFKSGVVGSFQTTPIVQNGIMYLSLPYNHVVALNAKTGEELWRYKHDRRPDWQMCCGPANRGVAVANGKVFIGTVDARLIALNAKTGAKEWDIDVVEGAIVREGQDSLNKEDPNSARKVTGGTGIGIAMAPVVYKGKVIVGITGVGYGLHIDNPTADAPLGAVIGVTGRFGRPGFLAAYDVIDGKRVWQFDTIPEKGWEGSFAQTTDDGVTFNRDIAQEKADLAKYPDSARFGGGSAWSTPAIDTATDTLYFGTGNPSPQMNDISRPGDNLYTVSLVALDTNTGKLKWHYQQVPHDLWGYDLASPPALFNYQLNGSSIAAVGQASKTGWFYVHDRATGKLLKKSEAFVPQHNLFKKATAEGVVVYPGILGGSNWSPVSVDEANQRVFVAGIHAPINYTLHETPAKDGKPAIRYAASEPTKDPRWGLLSAIDLSSGKIAWQNKTAQPLVGGVLATAGGVLFTGEGNGNFNAYNSQTGELLWQTHSDFGVNAPPITYTIDGIQYIAVASGGNSIFGYKQGDAVLVYKLGL
ncbi:MULTISPECIES: pyrroloquinoline quinone-dependent dehydrogenase [Methylotenera]|uniref:pyrroloquinoline quinone-dependent dehydrogenase n=1 Tax=Methylotenera TaxID=359407 RepID=UPI00037EBD6F|nr:MULTISPECIES: PQQ-binding-like beta-propeller repeat protein [Methylotenera]